MVTAGIGTALQYRLLKKRYNLIGKRRKEEKEEVSGYWMALRRREVTGN